MFNMLNPNSKDTELSILVFRSLAFYFTCIFLCIFFVGFVHVFLLIQLEDIRFQLLSNSSKNKVYDVCL